MKDSQSAGIIAISINISIQDYVHGPSRICGEETENTEPFFQEGLYIVRADGLSCSIEKESVAVTFRVQALPLIVVREDAFGKSILACLHILSLEKVLFGEDRMRIKVDVLIAKGTADPVKHILGSQSKVRQMQ